VVTRTSGELKIDQYARRILRGENREDIMRELPFSWQQSIESRLKVLQEDERLEDKSKRRDEAAIAELKVKHGFGNQRISPSVLESRKKLSDWEASYELARVAKNEGVDLATLTREEYVDYAILNFLKITDTQLRLAPWQRMAVSALDAVEMRKRKRAEITSDTDQAFARFDFEVQRKAASPDILGQQFANGVRVRTGTQDSNSWLFFAINDSKITEHTGETYKSYISLRDLNLLTPERFVDFMKALQAAGYKGDIKIFQDLVGQGINLNDQIVMHGNTEQDSRLALQVAEQFWSQELDQKSVGRDQVIDGKKISYSQILSMKIKNAIDNS
jgi:hypothetical protein